MGGHRGRIAVSLGAFVSAGVVLVVALVLPAAGSSSSPRSRPTPLVRPAPRFGLAGAKSDHAEVGTREKQALTSAAAVPIGTWRALGPAAIGPTYLAGAGRDGGVNSGRVTSIVQLPASGLHPNRVVIGAAGGGIWTSDNGGTTWTARSDGAADLAVGAVAVDPSNPNHVIAGTGEANQSADSFPGDGILVSTNAGTTWTLQNPGGVFNGLDVAQVAIDPSNSNHEFAATSGGLYATTNGGTSWAKPTSSTYTAVDGNVNAVVIDPTTPTNVYIGGTLAGGAHTVAKSTDGGTTWALADTGITAPGSSKSPLVALAIAKSSSSTLYASVGSVSAVALYHTTTGGSSWTKLTATPDYTGNAYAYGSGSGDQGWYDNVVAVDPTNPGHIVAGGETVVASSDTGGTWTNVNSQPFFGGGTNNLHPDQHALFFAADGSVWIGDDGGVFHYTPSTGAVSNANGNLDITQFYYGFNVVGNTLLAGSQDNASARTTSTSLTRWTGIWSGDGGPSAITPNSTQTQFVEADSDLYVTTNGFSSVLSNITPPQVGLFTPPMIVVSSTATPSEPTVYYGGPNLYRTTNPASGATWTQVTTESSAHVSAITASSNGQDVYVGFTNGVIEVSTNSGVTFTPLAASPSPETFVTGISINPANVKAITASFSYDDTRYLAPSFPHVYQFAWSTAPGTGTWTNITGNLPQEAVSRVVYDSGALVAATDNGVYATGAPAGGSTSWSRVGTGLPNVQVQDLFVTSSALYAVTHGRGAWRLAGPADLAVSLSGPASFPKGGNGSYTVTVTNNGPAPAAPVSLTDAVPAGTTFVSESQTSGSAFKCTNPAVGSTGTTSCTISSLASGASATFTLTYALPSATTQTSVSETAKASSSISPDPNTSNNSQTVSTPVA